MEPYPSVYGDDPYYGAPVTPPIYRGNVGDYPRYNDMGNGGGGWGIGGIMMMIIILLIIAVAVWFFINRTSDGDNGGNQPTPPSSTSPAGWIINQGSANATTEPLPVLHRQLYLAQTSPLTVSLNDNPNTSIRQGDYMAIKNMTSNSISLTTDNSINLSGLTSTNSTSNTYTIPAGTFLYLVARNSNNWIGSFAAKT